MGQDLRRSADKERMHRYLLAVTELGFLVIEGTDALDAIRTFRSMFGAAPHLEWITNAEEL